MFPHSVPNQLSSRDRQKMALVKGNFALFLVLGAIPTMIGLKCYITNPLHPEGISLTDCRDVNVNGNDASCGKTIGKKYK